MRKSTIILTEKLLSPKEPDGDAVRRAVVAGPTKELGKCARRRV